MMFVLSVAAWFPGGV